MPGRESLYVGESRTPGTKNQIPGGTCHRNLERVGQALADTLSLSEDLLAGENVRGTDLLIASPTPV